MLKYFWPVSTGKTFFDVWSIAHLSFWMFIGSALWPITSKQPIWLKASVLGGCLVVAYSWEIFERFGEKRWPTLWLNPESPLNSWVSDPLMCLLGVGFMWYALEYWR